VPANAQRFVTTSAIVLVVGSFLLWRNNRHSGVDVASAAPTRVEADLAERGKMTMSDVLAIAVSAREFMAENLDDYTARFVKQEVDASGVLGEQTEMLLKVQTRLRGDTNQAPMRVYMKFEAPESVSGRELIWGEDLYDGKMAVHETGFLLGLKTIWLDPHGMIAMRGQRYPISQIGMLRLVEKLIERGKKDRDNPGVSVNVLDDHKIDDTSVKLIQVRHAKPSGDKDDFSLAEIAIEPERQLLINYRSFGWPSEPGADPPLQESYSYLDVKTNVGLDRDDFDTTNSDYGFPTL
jgi:hypothetical protein